MTFYPPLLDYVKWVFTLAAVACFFRAIPETPGRRRGFVMLAAFVLGGLGIATAGTIGVLFNRHAPHILASGTVSAVGVHSGRGSSTNFRLSSAPAIDLSFSTTVRQIQNGETAKVVYQAGSGRVLDLRILTGPHAGFWYTEGDNIFGSIVVIALGFGLATLGFFKWSADPTAEPPEPRPDPVAVSSEIDVASLLHLTSDPPEEHPRPVRRQLSPEAEFPSLHLNDPE